MDDEAEEDHACVPCGAKFKFKSKLERHLATRKHKIFAGSITEDVPAPSRDIAQRFGRIEHLRFLWHGGGIMQESESEPGSYTVMR